MKPIKIIKLYKSKNGKVPFDIWLKSLKDFSTQSRILKRVHQLISGNAGDNKPVGKGVRELRLDFGPGFRIYYVELDLIIVLLLLGGDKSTQKKDIQKAHEFYEDFKTGGTYE